MSRANKKNEEIESASSSAEEVVTKKPATKKATVKKTPVKAKPAPKKEAKKEPVKENSEDEFSDIEVEDDDTMANAEPGTNDEVLMGVGKNSTQPQKQQQPQQRRIDPMTPIGELNVEQRINALIDLATETYNLPLKNRMLDVKREFTGKGKAIKPRGRGGASNNRDSYQPPMQQQYKPQNFNQNYRMMPETPNRDDYQMRGPAMYNNNGRGGQRGRGNRGGGNNPRRAPQDNDADVYADI